MVQFHHRALKALGLELQKLDPGLGHLRLLAQLRDFSEQALRLLSLFSGRLVILLDLKAQAPSGTLLDGDLGLQVLCLGILSRTGKPGGPPRKQERRGQKSAEHRHASQKIDSPIAGPYLLR